MFATRAQLQTLLPSVSDAVADQLLVAASAIIRGWTNQQIDYVTGDVVVLDPTDGYLYPGPCMSRGEMFLPQIPVRNVSRLEQLGPAGVWTTWADVATTDYAWFPDGRVRRVNGWWPSRQLSVRVTYDHGYQTIPDDLQAVCVQIAARMSANPIGAMSFTEGAIGVNFGRAVPGISDLQVTEELVLGRYRDPVLS